MSQRVLIVDDDRDLREAICDALSDEGYECMQAANGQEALKSLQRGPLPLLILLDLMMPMLNGWEFRAEQLRQPQLADIPVVVMSAYKSSEDAGVAANGYISKPLNLDVLITTVQRHLKRC